MDVKLYKTWLKREKTSLYLHAGLDYDTLQHQLKVSAYQLDIETSSRLLNATLEGIANDLAYRPIMKRLQFDVQKLVEEQKVIVNKLLTDKIELTKGVQLSGLINEAEVRRIIPQPQTLSLLFLLKGNAKIDVISLDHPVVKL
jgi:hypothetical protein